MSTVAWPRLLFCRLLSSTSPARPARSADSNSAEGGAELVERGGDVLGLRALKDLRPIRDTTTTTTNNNNNNNNGNSNNIDNQLGAKWAPRDWARDGEESGGK